VGKAEIILESKLKFLDTLASVGMSWWVSGIVFCATILAGCWLKRDTVIKVPFFQLFCATLTVFYLSVVGFGAFMAFETRNLAREVQQLLSSDPGTPFQTVFYGYLIGTTSFVLIALCWLGLWLELQKLRWQALQRERLVQYNAGAVNETA
jgi:hypothetical protein